MLNETEEAMLCQNSLIRQTMHHNNLCTPFCKYLLIEATSTDAVCVYFLGAYVEIQAGENHSNASREMIDMGAFQVMYKNVPLIAVHSCSGACWKIPSPPRAPGPPSPGNVSPHQPQRSIWCTSAHPSPPPVYLPPPSSYSCSRLGTHTHSGMH